MLLQIFFLRIGDFLNMCCANCALLNCAQISFNIFRIPLSISFSITHFRHIIIIIILIFIILIIVFGLLFLQDSRILMNFSSISINALINVIRNLNLAQFSVVRCIKSLSSGNVVVGSSCSLVINRNDSKFCTVIIFHYSNFVFAAPLEGACSTLTEVEAHINKIVGTFCHR